MMNLQKKEMTGRERIEATVKGLPVDRVPVMYFLNPHTACKMMAHIIPSKHGRWNILARSVWKIFEKNKSLAEDMRNSMPLMFMPYGNSEYVLHLGADMANIPFGTLNFWGKPYRENKKFRAKDAFGSVRGMGGIYTEVLEPAIKTVDDLKNFRFPDASHDKHYARIRSFRKKHPHTSIFTDNFGVQDLPSTQIWEMSRFMMALYEAPEEVKAFQKRFADWNIEVARRSIEAGADIIFIYDDYGYDNRTLISMDMWKEFTYPHLKRQIDAVHEAGAMVMLHSCGYQKPFLEYYVEAELDILQAFQPKSGNDFEEAYREYGDRICFATGIDIQQGESMSADELKNDIIRNYRIGGRNGRHILAMTHMLQYTMPEDNIRAIFNTVQDIQEGKYD